MPKVELGCRKSGPADEYLSLKFQTSTSFDVSDIFYLFGPMLTDFGKGHGHYIAKVLSDELEADPAGYSRLFDCWVHEYGVRSINYPVFNGVPKFDYFVVESEDGDTEEYEFPEDRYESSDILLYNFSFGERVRSDVVSLWRLAENKFRISQGLPKVGESWLSETELYNKLALQLPELELVRHARLPWLGRQHLDIFFPSLRVAIEYQGVQHDRPVDFFGGEPAFEKRKKLDRRKRRLCKKNNIR